jgi:hypothetical protein
MITTLFTLLLILELTAFIFFIRHVRSGWLALGLVAVLFVANMTLYALIRHEIG